MTAEPPLRSHFLGDARHLVGEDTQLLHHRVDGVFEVQHLPAHLDRDLLRQITIGDGRRHQRDVANLIREVRRHEVHVVGEILPCTAHALHARLAAENAFGAHLARHARHLARECRELVHHRVDRVLERQDLALGLDRDLPRQVALRHGRRHVGDVAHLNR